MYESDLGIKWHLNVFIRVSLAFSNSFMLQFYCKLCDNFLGNYRAACWKQFHFSEENGFFTEKIYPEKEEKVNIIGFLIIKW